MDDRRLCTCRVGSGKMARASASPDGVTPDSVGNGNLCRGPDELPEVQIGHSAPPWPGTFRARSPSILRSHEAGHPGASGLCGERRERCADLIGNGGELTMPRQLSKCRGHPSSRRIEVSPSSGELRLNVGEVRSAEGGVSRHSVGTVLGFTSPEPVGASDALRRGSPHNAGGSGRLDLDRAACPTCVGQLSRVPRDSSR